MDPLLVSPPYGSTPFCRKYGLLWEVAGEPWANRRGTSNHTGHRYASGRRWQRSVPLGFELAAEGNPTLVLFHRDGVYFSGGDHDSARGALEIAASMVTVRS